MVSIYSAVLAGMNIPSNFVVLKVRPSKFLALCDIGWGIFTFAQAGAQSYQAMYGFRFCVALFESFYYPVSFFLLGSWYTKPELAKRITLWFIASPAGSAFSGFMQAGIYNNMDGLHSIRGWRWLFIICGVMTLPIGIMIWFFVPDFPENTKVWYLTEEERQLARDRIARDGRDKVTKKIRWSVIRDCFKSWKLYILVIWFTIMALSSIGGKQFGVYLKSEGYSVTMRNVLPSLSSLLICITLIPYSYISDRTVRFGRGWVVLAIAVWGLLPTGILAFWPKSNSLRVAGFMLNSTTYSTPIFFAWVADICGKQHEERAFITGFITAFWYATDAWINTIIYKQTDGPRFKKGFTTAFATDVISIFTAPLVMYLQHLDERKYAMKEAEAENIASEVKDQEIARPVEYRGGAEDRSLEDIDAK
ncbi:hypothetical protein I302_101448 [Kwoniella bestiolae CBS 10118]